MTAFRTRIGSVQMKSGGAKLHIMQNNVNEKVFDYLRDDVAEIAEHPDGNAVGYALVVWDGGGAHYTRAHVARGTPVSVTSVPDFAKAALTHWRIERSVRERMR